MKYKDVALKAIKQYNLVNPEMKYLTEETNVFYYVKTEDKEYVLKIFQEESSNLNDNLAEHYLISVVKAKTDILTPMVVKNKDGLTVTKIPFNNQRGYKRAALYSYVSGDRIDGFEDDVYFMEIGALIAKMHLATKDIFFPDYVNPKRWNKVFYYENEKAIYKDPKYAKYVSSEMIEILDKLIPYIDQKLKDFYETDKPQLIHGDLNPWNIKKASDRYVIYDFEEALLAYPLHDIATFMYYYKFDETHDYRHVYETFMKGYVSVKELPLNLTEKNLELIMMARRINFFNYSLLVNSNPKEYIHMSFARIKEYYLSYK